MANVGFATLSVIPSFKGAGAALGGELKGVGAAGDRAGRDAGSKLKGGFGASIKGIAAPLAGIFAGIKVVSFFKDSIGEARESAKVTALSAAAIKSTGGVANVTAGDMASLSTAISNKTGIDDEAIQSASNLLLTFTGVRNEVGKNNDIFNQATQLTTDMSVALGTDAKGSAIQLGKALNDPIKGVSALSRVGVSFTAQQKDQIKTLVESGDTLGAQKVILGELSKEFGGAAAAAASPADKLKVSVGNLKESVGTALLPVLDKFATILSTNVIPAVVAVGGFVAAHATTFKVLATVLGAVLIPVIVAWGIQSTIAGGKAVAAWVAAQLGAIKSAAAQGLAVVRVVAGWVLMGVQSLLGAAKMAAAWLIAMGPIAIVIAAVVAIGILIWKNWDNIKKWTKAAWDFVFGKVSGAVTAVIGFVKRNWPLLLAILTGPFGMAVFLIAKNWDKIKAGVSAVKDFVVNKFNAVVGFFKGLPGRIGRAVSGMWDGIKDAFKGAVNWIIKKWNDLEFHIGGFKVFGKTMPSVTIGTPNIPLLAAGGVVTQPTLAMLGEAGPEAVVPLPRYNQLGGGGSVTVNQTINNPVPERASVSGPVGIRRAALALAR